MKTKTLHAFIGEQKIGEVCGTKQRAQFTYHPTWTGHPVSLGLQPGPTLPQKDALPYFKGLLPDDEKVRQAWGNQYQVDPTDTLALLSQTGLDAPGAIQLYPHPNLPKTESSATALTRQELTTTARALQLGYGTWNPQDAPIQERFSLGGAQQKTAVYIDPAGRYYKPSGRFPSTHILKAEISSRFKDSQLNEAVSMRAAHLAGINTAPVDLVRFGAYTLCQVARYDRQVSENTITRLHQEDMCQILRIDPQHKYTSDGGPGVNDIIKILHTHTDQDSIDAFLAQLAFNVAILGTDAHAKNFSILYHPDGTYHLAPAYDIISFLPYQHLESEITGRSREIKLAMSIGGQIRGGRIKEKHWVKLAQNNNLNPDRVLTIVKQVYAHTPDALNDAVKHFKEFIPQDSPVKNLPAQSSGLIDHLSSTSIWYGPKVVAPGEIWVRPYTRRDGTQVEGHWRKKRGH